MKKRIYVNTNVLAKHIPHGVEIMWVSPYGDQYAVKEFMHNGSGEAYISFQNPTMWVHYLTPDDLFTISAEDAAKYL